MIGGESFHNYQHILQHFGVDDRSLAENINDADKPALLAILSELDMACKALEAEGKPISTNALINWAALLADTELSQTDLLQKLLSTSTQNLNTSAKASDAVMTYVYLGMNTFGLLLSLANLEKLSALSAISHDTVNAVSGGAWNYIDAIGGVVLGIRQIAQGEAGMGVVNILNGAQLASFTVVADIARYSSAIQLSAATINAFMGFSFAACLAVSCGLEMYEARKCTKRIKALEAQLLKVQLALLEPGNAENREMAHKENLLRNMILIEYAQRANHKRAAASWMACAVAMTAVAIFSYFALSAVTFGALPAATVVAAAAAVVSGLIRKWWVSHKDHVANVKTDLLLVRLNVALDNPQSCLKGHLDKPVTLPGVELFHAKKTTLREYLTEMVRKDIPKIKKIMYAIEQNNLEQIKAALGEHRSYAATGGRWWGKSTGQKIAEQLFGDKQANFRNDSPYSPRLRSSSN